MTTLPVPRCHYGLRVILGIFLWIAVSALAQPAPEPLEKGVPLEREIRGGETHAYLLPVEADSYARLSVEQTGVDLAVRVLTPSGEVVAALDGPGGHKEPERLSWIAAQGGLRLEISPRQPDSPPGQYRLTLEEARAAGPGDETRVEAERQVSEGLRWRARDDGESTRRALELFKAAVPLWESVGDRARQAEALNLLGSCHRRLGETDAAVAAHEKALELARQSGSRLQEAEARNDLAVLYDDHLADPRALSYYESALALWEAEGDRQSASSTLYNLGLYWATKGDRGQALDCLGRSLELKRALADRAGEARVLGAMGSVRRIDEPDAALELFDQALKVLKDEESRPARVQILRAMASTYLNQGELQKALELYTQALEIARTLGDRTSEGMVLSSLGATALHLGDTDMALRDYEEALELHRAVKNVAWEAYTLRDIGWVQSLRGEPALALENYTRALEISQKADDEIGQAASLQGLGRARLDLGKPGEAMRDIEEAVAIYRKSSNFAEVGALLDLGRARLGLGETDKAAGTFRQALDLSRQRHMQMTEAVSQAAIARLERDRGHLDAAAGAIGDALRILESLRPKLASQRLRISFFASRREYYDLYIDIQMRMHERSPGAGHLAAAFAGSEQGRVRALLDLLAEGRIDVRQGIAAELKQKETDIDARIAHLQSQLLADLSERNGINTARIETGLSQAEDERERLEWQIRQQHPRYAAIRSPSPLALEKIQSLLDGRTALLEFAVGQERSFLFVVTRDGLAGYPLPPAAELAKLVEPVLQGVQSSGRRQLGRYTQAAWKLYQVLIQPAEPVLRDKPRLILSPDGPLLLLSFEALLTAPPPDGAAPGALPYLILDRSVSYAPSASVLAELRQPRASTPAASDAPLFLGFGDPDYGSPAPAQAAPTAPPEGDLARSFQQLLHPEPLPASRTEVSNIAALFPQGRAEVFLGPQATEDNVRNNPDLKTARFIHFAVHGFLNESHPELSGLVLSRAGPDREVTLLQVYEMFNLELSADVVVLSACETGLGKNVSGEGLIGMSRALLYAGADSVVVSLWRVADVSTADLMVRFYRHLNETGDRAEALRLSKLELIREGRFDLPYSWAPFILIGEPRPEAGVTSGTAARQ